MTCRSLRSESTFAFCRPAGGTCTTRSRTRRPAFLVLAGECLLLIEEEERQLRVWDFVHCPPGAAHGFLAVGKSQCVILMVGARTAGWEEAIVYPRSELALSHGIGVEQATDSPAEALAAFPRWQRSRPQEWTSLPWA